MTNLEKFKSLDVSKIAEVLVKHELHEEWDENFEGNYGPSGYFTNSYITSDGEIFFEDECGAIEHEIDWLLSEAE